MAFVTNLPVNGSFNVTAVFGQKGSLWKNGHKGIDLTASKRTLYSVCDGTVTVVGFDKNGWGRYVSVKPDGFERVRFIICHMVENSAKVKVGDRVGRTTVLGTMGSSGNSTGVHVHVEMRIDNNSVDPTPYLLIANNKATGLKAENYKFDAACQKTALTAVVAAFDKGTAPPTISGTCTGGSDESALLEAEILSLKTELAELKDKLYVCETKIKNAQNALK